MLSIDDIIFVGIVPVSCDELFKRIEAARAKAEKGEEYQVSIFAVRKSIYSRFYFAKDTKLVGISNFEGK